METAFEAVTIRLADALGHLKAIRGIHARWDEDSKRHIVGLGGGKIKIPIIGAVSRGKSSGRNILRYVTLERVDGTQYDVDQLDTISGSQFLICTLP